MLEQGCHLRHKCSITRPKSSSGARFRPLARKGQAAYDLSAAFAAKTSDIRFTEAVLVYDDSYGYSAVPGKAERCSEVVDRKFRRLCDEHEVVGPFNRMRGGARNSWRTVAYLQLYIYFSSAGFRLFYNRRAANIPDFRPAFENDERIGGILCRISHLDLRFVERGGRAGRDTEAAAFAYFPVDRDDTA